MTQMFLVLYVKIYFHPCPIMQISLLFFLSYGKCFQVPLVKHIELLINVRDAVQFTEL